MFSPAQLEVHLAEHELLSFINEQDLASLETIHARDEELIAELQDKNPDQEAHVPSATGLRFANAELAKLTQEEYSVAQLSRLEKFLGDKGTLNIPIVEGHKITVDGVEHDILLVGATEQSENGTNHGEMSSMFYLRDHIQAARALMELNLRDPARYEQEGILGKKLLISVLHCMATPKQLERYRNVIELGTKASQEDWPHISLWPDDLQGEKDNGWRNKQDTFQMLTHLTLDALDRDFIDVATLSQSHKQFLGSAVPLLAAVGFPGYESSGSWEEVAARRTSVMAVETALLHKIANHQGDKFDFLQEVYENSRLIKDTGKGFDEQVSEMLDAGLMEIGRRLPFESPDYAPGSVKYREGDAALAYVLMYGLPQMLTAANIPIGKGASTMSAREIEDLVLSELEKLFDPETNGVIRYKEDSYQRVNFHTNEVQLIVGAIKKRVKHDANKNHSEVDLDNKQVLRNELTPKGKEAAWTHSLGQLSEWATRRKLEEADGTEAAKHYKALGTMFANLQMSTITGKNRWNAVLDKNGNYKLQPAAEFRLSECIVTYQTSSGERFTVPSPHTPLNWSAATLKLALGLLRVAASKEETS
ncbi:MAG TPA: hypothetical protein VLA92_00890 [Candidatus Saccharimonadales bacterium]|nr:hypothetical protein [Candidatus Saccharimonadales bacterium]